MIKERWIVEAEYSAKRLAHDMYEQIMDEADDQCVDRRWFFEKVINYMQAGSEDKE